MLTTLYGSAEYLTGELAAAPATTQPNYHATYRDINNGEIPGSAVGALTGSTALSLIGGEAGKNRIVDSLLLYNADTATVLATIKKVSGGVGYPIIKAQVPVGGTLFARKDGFTVLDQGGTVPTSPVGAVVSGLNITCAEEGYGPFRKTTLTFAATPLAITDALTYAGLKIYDFPAGRIRVLDCLASLAFTTTSVIASTLNSGVTVSYGFGSATASAATLATTMMNFMPGSGETVKSFTSSTTINVASAGVTGLLAAVSAAQLGAILDGTATAVDMFLNLAVPTNTDIDGDSTLTVTGSLQFAWLNGGDI